MTATLPRLGRNASKIAPKAIRWLVPNVLAQGLATCLTGTGGVGKSSLMVRWAADLSVGRPLVPGSKIPVPSETVIVSTEESAEHVIVPKLMAAGADLTKITVFDEIEDTDDQGEPMMRGLSLPGDSQQILQVVRESGAVMLVLDPVAELLDDRHSADRDKEVRRVLAPLRKGCRDLGCALVWMQHTNKRGEPMGSVAWVNMSRINMQVWKHPDDPGRSVLFLDKTNHGEAPGWEFHMDAVSFAALGIDDPDGDNSTPDIVWDGQSGLSADDVKAGAPATKEDRQERDDAVLLWRRHLGDTFDEGKREWVEGGFTAWSKDVDADARGLGVSQTMLKKARVKLALESVREDFGKGGRWGWKRPDPPRVPIVVTPFAPSSNGHHPEEGFPFGRTPT